jgi:hypothetical protein
MKTVKTPPELQHIYPQSITSPPYSDLVDSTTTPANVLTVQWYMTCKMLIRKNNLVTEIQQLNQPTHYTITHKHEAWLKQEGKKVTWSPSDGLASPPPGLISAFIKLPGTIFFLLSTKINKIKTEQDKSSPNSLAID